MAVYQYFDSFGEAIAEKTHNLGSDVLKVMLTNSAPLASYTVKTDVTEIGAGNGYTAGGSQATIASSSTTGSTYKLVINDVVFTASGGTIGPFRYAVLYNDTAASKQLIGFWDYASSITLNDGEAHTVDFDPTTGVLTITHA